MSKLVEPSCGALPRVVDHTVDAAPPRDGRIDESFEVGQSGDIGLHGKSITPGVPQTLLGGGQSAGVPPADGYLGSLLDEPVCESRAEPVGPTGNQDDLAIQVQIH